VFGPHILRLLPDAQYRSYAAQFLSATSHTFSQSNSK